MAMAQRRQRRRQRRHTAAAVMLLLAVHVGRAAAQSTTTESTPSTSGATTTAAPTVEERIQELDQQIRILKRQLELEKEQAAAAPQRPVVTAGPEGFSVRSGDSNFSLRLRGYLHADGRFFTNDPQESANNAFLMRRVRPIVEATLYRRFDFRIMPDFGDGRTVIQDAYVDLRFTPAVKVRAGKFKSPVGLERLVSATELLFTERGLPTGVAPNRDIGIMVHGDIREAVVSYAAGVFDGTVDGGSVDTDDGDGKDAAGRLFFQPFRRRTDSRLAGLGLGVVGTFGRERGTAALPALPQYRTSGQQVFFRLRTDGTAAGTTLADGDRWRAGVQGYYYFESFGLFGEQIHSSQEIRRADTIGSLDSDAYQVAASYVVTGERATPRGVTPRRAFEPQNGAWGAFEVTARFNALDVGRDVFPVFANPDAAARRARAWGAGVNWYLSRAVKITVDFEQTAFTGGAAAGSDRPTSRDVLSRIQLAF